MLLIGIVVLVFGLSDLLAAGLIARKQSAPGGLGPTAEPPPVARILKLTGAFTIVAGVVLIAIGLAS